MLGDHIHHAGAVVGRFPGEDVIKGNAQRVHIRAEIDVLSGADLFRAHVGGRSHQQTIGGGVPQRVGIVVQFLGDPQVQQLDLAGFCQHDICRFHIPVDDPLVIPRIFQCRRHATRNVTRLILRKLERPPHQIKIQVVSLNIFHGEPHIAPVVAAFIDPHHVRVFHGGEKTHFPEEAVQIFLVGDKVVPQHFQCHDPVHGDLFRLVDQPHTAGADLAFDHIITNTGKLLLLGDHSALIPSSFCLPR